MLNKIKNKLTDPHFAMKFHASLAVFFILMIPPSALWFANSVPYLVALSIWALIAAHWAAFQASHGELKEQSGLQNEDLDTKLDVVIVLLKQMLDAIESEKS